MTNKTTIVAIAAITALLAGLPIVQEAQAASIAYAPRVNDNIGFDSTVNFSYDMVTGNVGSESVSYAAECYENIQVGSSYSDAGNYLKIEWDVPDQINYMCNLSELSDYTNFVLTGVDWSIQSDNNPTVTGSSTSDDGSSYTLAMMGSSGNVSVTFTAHYNWAPVP